MSKFPIELFIILATCCSFNLLSAQDYELRAYPGSIVFNSVEARPYRETRSIFIFTALDSTVSWRQSTDVPWLTLNLKEGMTNDVLKAGVNNSGLVPGIHMGNIRIESPQSHDGVIIPVTLVVNPDVPVKIATWKEDLDAAMSVSVDDGQASAFDELLKNGFVGTYVSNGITPPSFYTDYYKAGMELGSHLVSHPCYIVSDSILIFREIQPNTRGICDYTPVPCNDIISLVWPCGVTSVREQAIASGFFLSARGYNINQLEESAPENFMNLKSFNSHEHTPYPPLDLKTVVDSAVSRHKWFNLVLHSMTNDDGAIQYARTKNIWVNSIGTVIKYILQRERFILEDYKESEDKIMFHISRLPISAIGSKDFEEAFGPEDLTTLKIDIEDNRIVEKVFMNGILIPFQTKEINGNTLIITNVRLEPAISKKVEIKYLTPYKLLQNYPNPFKEVTWTEFYLADDSQVLLEVYNSLGQKVETILNQHLKTGSYKIKWESGQNSSGTYYLSLKTKKFSHTIKMSLLK